MPALQSQAAAAMGHPALGLALFRASREILTQSPLLRIPNSPPASHMAPAVKRAGTNARTSSARAPNQPSRSYRAVR